MYLAALDGLGSFVPQIVVAAIRATAAGANLTRRKARAALGSTGGVRKVCIG